MKGDRGEHHSIAAALGRPSVTILRTSTFSRGSDRADLTGDSEEMDSGEMCQVHHKEISKEIGKVTLPREKRRRGDSA